MVDGLVKRSADAGGGGDEGGVMGREEGAEGGGADEGGELPLGGLEVVLDLVDLVLEERDVAHAAVDGVSEPGLGLVREGVDGVLALRGGELVEELRHVARAEHAVHVGEFRRLVGGEVGREHAALRALAPQELAGGARRVGRRHRDEISKNGKEKGGRIRVRVFLVEEREGWIRSQTFS